jgi:O-antigen/teichoic acid export membrane protein
VGSDTSSNRSDQRAILSGTGQNIAGLAIFVLVTFATNILISRVLGAPALGVITLATQFAFVAGAATRFGMDMAAVRRVAIDVGRGEPGRVRSVMARAVAIAAVVSIVGSAVVFLGAEGLSSALAGTPAAFRAAALATPFVALCQVYLGGTRGLKIMRHTLSIYWAGQPLLWMAALGVAWAFSTTIGVSVLAYGISWFVATAAAWFVWERETAAFPRLPAEPGEIGALVRYGAPRAPAALLAQLLFWTDYFVFSHYATGPELGVYAAAVRVAQALVLFLIAVNYMFSPFVADLYARGERDRLDGLFKTLTRWVVAGTMPILLLLLIVPGPVLHLFGGEFQSGTAALRILLIGQTVNVATGSVGFILIMVGRTGWDLAVYAGSFALDLIVAFALVPHFGAEGAATAQAVTLVASNAVRLGLVWRFVHIQPFDRQYARLGIPALLGGLAMLGTHLLLRDASWPADLLVSGAVGTLVYAAALIGFGLAASERETLRRVAGGISPWRAGSPP